MTLKNKAGFKLFMEIFNFRSSLIENREKATVHWMCVVAKIVTASKGYF